MTDHVSREKRSEIMRAVGSKNSRPELLVRRLLHRAGYRFRLHRADLPGTPDIVLPGRRKVIFVHGCFWHGHRRCAKARLPKSNVTFWAAKVDRNRRRDKARIRELQDAGWRAAVVWQCETRAPDKLMQQLSAFLEKR